MELLKQNGQRDSETKVYSLAVAVSGPRSSAEKGVKPGLPSKVDPGSRPQEQPPTKRMVGGSNPSGGTISAATTRMSFRTPFNSPTGSVNYPWGLTSGLRQRQGFYAHCHFDACARRKQRQNDLPQLPDRSQALWKAPQRPPALP